MGIGAKDTELDYGKRPELAFEDLRQALSAIGKVEEADPEAMFLRGRTRFGLQRVRIKLRVASSVHGSTISIHALADDLWGMGAKKGIDKLITALEGL